MRAVLLLLLSLAATTAAEAGVLRYHFRLVVGTREAKTVAGYLDLTDPDGEAKATADLDLTGDGKPETRVPLVRTDGPVVGGRVAWRRYEFSFEHEGATWGVNFMPPPARFVRTPVFAAGVGWWVARDGLRLEFGKGPAARLTDDRKAWGTLPAIRIGAPLDLRATTSHRGPDAVLGAVVSDAGGHRLLCAERDERELRVAVDFRVNGESVVTASLEYG